MQGSYKSTPKMNPGLTRTTQDGRAGNSCWYEEPVAEFLMLPSGLLPDVPWPQAKADLHR